MFYQWKVFVKMNEMRLKTKWINSTRDSYTARCKKRLWYNIQIVVIMIQICHDRFTNTVLVQFGWLPGRLDYVSSDKNFEAKTIKCIVIIFDLRLI